MTNFLKLYSFVLVLMFVPKNIFSQDVSTSSIKGRAEYFSQKDSTLFERDLLKLKEKKPEAYTMMAENMRIMNKILADLSFELIFDGSQSLYRALPVSAAEIGSDDFWVDQAKIMGGGDKSQFLDNEKKIRLYEFSVDEGVTYIHVTEPYEKINWKITNDTKKIGSYNCRFASGSFLKSTHCCGIVEIPIAVWFAPELPVAYGPAGFDGLPGLVVKASVGDPEERAPMIYQLKSITIGKDAYKHFPKLHKPTDTVTEEELDKMAEKIFGKRRR